MSKQAMREEAERLIRETMEKKPSSSSSGNTRDRGGLRQMRCTEPRPGGKGRNPRQICLQAMRRQQVTL
jgi:hypothetical protein